MQNMQDVLASSNSNNNNNRLNGKSIEIATGSGSDVIKKFRISQPRDTECREPAKVAAASRDQTSALSPNQNSDKQFQTSIVADKYLLLEQAEGSSLYRCVDVNTQEELVCKVSVDFLFSLRPKSITRAINLNGLVSPSGHLAVILRQGRFRQWPNIFT